MELVLKKYLVQKISEDLQNLEFRRTAAQQIYESEWMDRKQFEIEIASIEQEKMNIQHIMSFVK